MFKVVRILNLLMLLATAAFYAKTQKLKSRYWPAPLDVVIYRINGDHNSTIVNDYISELDDSLFAPIDQFIEKQSQKYDLITSHPTQTHLGPVISVQSPESPSPASNYAAIIWRRLNFVIGLTKTRRIRSPICTVSGSLFITMKLPKVGIYNTLWDWI